MLLYYLINLLNIHFELMTLAPVAKNTLSIQKNIYQSQPLHSESLSQMYKSHDIFIFASIIEACSNTIREALHCG